MERSRRETAKAVVELIILVGLQASGKSTFVRERFEASHTIVSKDNFRNNRRPARRQLQLVADALRAGQSVVVDNTNPTRETREGLIKLAREQGAAVVGYYLSSSAADCLLHNSLRLGREKVPEVAIYATAKQLVRPSLDEGFDELHFVKIGRSGFVVEPFREEWDEKRGP